MSSPTPHDPNAHPSSAPTIIAKPVVPSRRPEAVARECGEVDVAAAIGPEHTTDLVTVR
jgi:hypothetical protein